MPRPNLYFDNLESKIESDYKHFARDFDKINNQSNLYTLTREDSYVNTLESARSSFVSDIALVFNDK